MDTQYILLVWVCCLTPLFPVFCCRNKDEFRTAAGLGEGTLHKRDILSGEVKGKWSPKQSSTRCDFQRPSGASRKCQNHPHFHLSNSESGDSPSEWWNSFTTVLTVKVFPLLTNLFCWLVIFWIFNLSSTTSTGNQQHQFAPANQKHRKTPRFKKSGGRPINLIDRMYACSLNETPNLKRMHPGTSSVCTSTVAPESEEYISEKDNTFNVAFIETCQSSTAKFSVTDPSDCTMQESRDLVPTDILQETMEGIQLSHPSLVYNRSSDGDKIKKRGKLFTQSPASNYTTEDDDISELTTEDMEVAFLTRLNEMATESTNRQIQNMTQRGENSQRKKARDVRQLSTVNKCIEFSALGTPSKPHMSSHPTQVMSNQPTHLLKRKSIVQENISRCPLPFPKDRSETGRKAMLIREPDCVKVKSKRSYSTMHACEISQAKKDETAKQRENLEQTPSFRGRNRDCCHEPVKSGPHITSTPYLSYEGNCSETKRLAFSAEDPIDSYRRQLLRNRSLPIDRHRNMAKGLLQLGDASDAEQLSLGKRHSITNVASEPRLPCAQRVRQGLECSVLPDDATRQLGHDRCELTDSPPPAWCVDDGVIGRNRFPNYSSDNRKDISSYISRFQNFCQRLLETSSFEETDDVEHFNPDVTMASSLDDEEGRLISPFQDGTTTEVVFLTETIRDDECLETPSSSVEQPWSAMCLGDPERKLENVPVFYNHLVSSCIETERTKKSAALDGAYIITGGLSTRSEKANERSTPLEDENLGGVPELLCQPSSSSNTVTEYPLESQRDDDQAKGLARSKGTSKPLEVPLDIDFVYMSSKSGRLVPVKDFIKILESCYLGIEEKKKIVSEQYSIAREKCCLDWIEAIRNRGRRILPKWWLHRYMRVEGLESNKCRKRREWLERKQVQALEEERLRDRKDLHFLGARSDIARYLDEPSGPEKLLFEYDESGIPTFQVEDYFEAIFHKCDAPGLSAENKVNLNQGMPSRWTSPPLVMSVELSAEKCVRNPNYNNSAAGEPRENPASRKADMKQVKESPPVDRAKEDGSGDSLCEY